MEPCKYELEYALGVYTKAKDEICNSCVYNKSIGEKILEKHGVLAGLCSFMHNNAIVSDDWYELIEDRMELLGLMNPSGYLHKPPLGCINDILDVVVSLNVRITFLKDWIDELPG